MQYEAPGWGVGEVWLDERGRVFHCELPRPRRTRPGPVPGHDLASRLAAFFSGEPETFRGVKLKLPDGDFDVACARALRKIPRGEVVSYGELATLAGYPGAARAAGTFCGRCALSPFVPTHRVVGANGIGSYGDLGVDYKRRLLALEDILL